MKKLIILFALATALFTISCNEKEDSKEVDMRFYAYTKYTPSSKPSNTSAKFFLFDASNGQQFKEERIEVPSGDYFDYSNIKSEMVTLLRNNEFELIDGTRVKPIPIQLEYHESDYINVTPSMKNPNLWDDVLSHNFVNIPYGKYYIVALISNVGGGWEHRDKYSGKYIEVKKNMPISDKKIEISFPYDGKHKGFIDWVTTDW